ncbi:MAG: hypothetical protein ABIG95_03050 [Candidatus Woesearchaeota archaeon]
MTMLSPEKYFYVCDGSVIRYMGEVVGVLNSIADESFSYHVNEHKNDFAKWVGDVFGRTELAERLMAVRTRKDMMALLEEEILEQESITVPMPQDQSEDILRIVLDNWKEPITEMVPHALPDLGEPAMQDDVYKEIRNSIEEEGYVPTAPPVTIKKPRQIDMVGHLHELIGKAQLYLRIEQNDDARKLLSDARALSKALLLDDRDYARVQNDLDEIEVVSRLNSLPKID